MYDNISQIFENIRKYKFIPTVFFIGFSLVICIISKSCNGPVVEGGPGVDIGPIIIKLLVDSDGNVRLGGGYSHTIIGKEHLLALNWETTINKEIIENRNRKYFLSIIYEGEGSDGWKQIYNIGQRFIIDFGKGDWVRRIESDDRGNIVLFIIRTILFEENKVTNIQTETISVSKTEIETETCDKVALPKLHIGDLAKVIVFQQSVKSAPGRNSSTDHLLAKNRTVTILDGPICKDNYWWWKIHFAGKISTGEYLDFIGWMAESDLDDVLLIKA